MSGEDGRFDDGSDERAASGAPGSGDALPCRVEIPDDASALEPDRRAWLAEVSERQRVQTERQRLQTERQRLQIERQRALRRERSRRRLGLRLPGLTRPWGGYGTSAPILIIALALVAVVGTLAVGFGPRLTPHPAAAPLAASTLEPGSPGGLLPDVAVGTATGRSRSVRALRPSVLALVPAGCGCDAELAATAQQARGFALRFWMVAAPGALPEVLHGAARVGSGGAGVLEDVHGRLMATYAAHELVLLLVRADGVVAHVLRDVGVPLRLEPQLSRLATDGT